MPYEKLFSPIRIGALTLKNRLMAAPSLPVLARPDGSAGQELIDYYAAKAKGGAGVVTVGESAVDFIYGTTHAAQLNIGSDLMIPSLSLVAEAIKRHGAVASLEICHGGRQTLPAMIGGKDPIAPSPLSSPFHEFLAGGKITVQEMNPEQIEMVIESFAAAALRLKRAGFDMVMLHGGHGWMLAQWLSPFSNRRTDQYGGSLENRARFPLEVIDRVRSRIGPEMAIEYRMSGEELTPGGLTREEAVLFARMIQDKVDCINVSVGMMANMDTIPNMHPPYYMPYGPNVQLASVIKQAVSIPVSCVGAINDPELAEEILASDQADLVAMTRALIADPELPLKSQRGRRKEIIPCTRCLECLGRVATFLPIRCSVNPVTGRETELKNTPPSSAKKKVLVAGGGPAGLEAAAVAARRGHRVTLLEKSDHLGGNLVLAAAPPFKEDTRRYLSYLIERIKRSSIDLRLDAEATPQNVTEISPDVIIAAVGAGPLVPDIPGITGSNVVWAGDVVAGRAKVGRRVVVAGGGFMGSETALVLAQSGKQVSLVEMTAEIATVVNPASRIQLLSLLVQNQVAIHTRNEICEIFDGGLSAIDQDRQRHILEADTVVLALGMTPRTEVVCSLQGLAPEIRVVGDCLKPRKIIDAVEEGFFAALEI